MAEKIKNNNDDWFKGRVQGTITGNYADVLNNNPGKDYTMQTREYYENDKDFMASYEKKYGEKAKEVFNEQYDIVAQDYQNYSQGNFDKLQTSEFTAMPGWGFLYGPGTKERSLMFDVGTINATNDGSRLLMNEMTQRLYDPRYTHAKSNVYFDAEGNEYKMATKDEAYGSWAEDNSHINSYNPIAPTAFFRDVMKSAPMALADGNESGMAYMINNSKYTNAEGKKIIGWVYRDGSLEKGSRIKPGYQAVYEGEYMENAHKQVVSLWDAYSPSKDLEAGVLDFVPRTLNNFVVDINSMANAVGASVHSLFSGNEALDTWEDALMNDAMSKVSTSVKTQEGGALGTWDGIAGLASDVILQLMSGKFFGTAAAKLAVGGLRAGLIKTTAAGANKVVSNFARAGSITGMSLYGAKDMYTSALANGYSAREASFLYTGAFASMLAVNHLMNGLEGTFETMRWGKAVSEIAKKEAPYLHESIKQTLSKADDIAVETLKESGKEVAEKTKIAYIRNKAGQLARYLSSKTTTAGKSGSTLKKYLGAANYEGMEEMAELIGEETIKHGHAALKAMFGWEGEERADGRTGHFKNMYDEGYWEEIGSGLFESYVGGALGGAMAKTPLFKKILGDSDHEKMKNTILDFELAGKGELFTSTIDKLHKQGLLGDTKLSTVYDSQAGAYKPVSESNPKSMNDASKEIILQQYQYIKDIIAAAGGADAFNSMAKKHPELVEDLNNNSLVNDIKKLNKEYIDIMVKYGADPSSNPNGIKTIIDEKLSQEEQEEKIAKFAAANNMDQEDAERLAKIETELNDIKSGKAAEKYLLENLSKDTVLDYKNLSKDIQEKHGKTLMYDLMAASAKEVKEGVETSEEVDKVIAENEAIINDLKPDLSNIDTAKPLLNAKNLFLNDASKAKIKELFENWQVSDAKLETYKGQVKEEIEKTFTTENLKKLIDFKTLTTDEERSKFLYLAQEAFTKKSLNLLNAAKTVSEVENVRLESLGKINLINYLANVTDNFDDFGQAYFEDKINTLIKSPEKTKEDIDKFVNNEFANNFKVHNDNLKQVISNTNDEGFIVPFNDEDFLNMKALYEKSLSAEGSKNFKLSQFVNHFKRGFSGQQGNIINTTDLNKKVDALIYAKNKAATATGTNLFSDVEGVESALFQVEARLAQLEILVSEKQAETISNFNKTIANLIAKPGEKYLDVISKIESDEYGLFHTAKLRPQKYAELKAKSDQGKALTAEEQNILEEEKEKIDALNEIYKDLQISRLALLELKKAAEEGKKLVKDATIHKDSMIAAMKEEDKVLTEFLDHTSFRDNEIVKEYQLAQFNDDRYASDEELIKNFDRATKVKALLFNSTEAEKERALNSYFSRLKSYDLSEVPTEVQAERFKKAILATTLNADAFYQVYGELMANQKGAASGEQEQAIMEIVAHLTSDIAAKFLDKASDNNKTSQYASVLYGVQGSGKSSFVLGTANRIAQILNGGGKVLLASNQPEQVKILADTMSKFGVSIHDKTFNSVEAQPGKWSPQTLIDYLSKIENVKDVDTIIFDEITYVEFEKDKLKESDLGTIFDKVDIINEERAKRGERKLKLILAGDNTQNGYVDETGSEKNLDTATDFYKTIRLEHNFRNLIPGLNTFVRSQILKEDKEGIQKVKATELELTNLISEYGLIKGGELLGGLQFDSEEGARDRQFNNQELVDNIKEQIKNSKVNNEEFKVGIILPSLNDKPGDNTLLGKLINDNDFKDNFKLTTHNSVQGQEFDYVISIVTNADLGASYESQTGSKLAKERAARRKLATTIGRARYYSLVINETPRNFSSKQVNDITIVPQDVNQSVVDAYKKLRAKMFATIEPVNIEVVKEESAAKLEEEIKNEEEIEAVIVEDTARKEEGKKILEGYRQQFSDGSKVVVNGQAFDYTNWDGENRLMYDDGFGNKKAVIFNEYGEAFNNNTLTPLLSFAEENPIQAAPEEIVVEDTSDENIIKVYHHTNVAPQDFDFGNFQRGNQQVSQFGDGLNAATTTNNFFVNRYGNPIEGEVNDSDFIVIDSSKSQKEIYEFLVSKGFKFNNPQMGKDTSEGGKYINGNPAEQYDDTDPLNESPGSAIELFNDFQQSNPEVKGVKVLNHIIDNQKIDPFYVIYDAKSFYGPGSLSSTEEGTVDPLENFNKVRKEFIALAEQEVTERGFEMLMEKLSNTEGLTLEDKAEINDEILKVKQESGLFAAEEVVELSGKSEEDLDKEIEEAKAKHQTKTTEELEKEKQALKEINEKLEDVKEVEEGFQESFIDFMDPDSAADARSVEAGEVLTALSLLGFDSAYTQFSGKLLPGETKAQANYRNIKERINTAYGKDTHDDSISYEDYRITILEALGLRKTKTKFNYEVTFSRNEDGALNVLYVAKGPNNKPILLGFPLIGSMADPIKLEYENMAATLEVTSANPVTLPINNPTELLGLNYLSPGGLTASRNKYTYNAEAKARLEKENPGVKIADAIFISTEAFIVNEKGESIENPFRGDAFLLYTFNDKLNKFNNEDLNRILLQGLPANRDKRFTEKFANGVGMIRLDNKPSSFEEIYDMVSPEDVDITKKEFSEDINNGRTQRALAAFFTDIILADADLSARLSQENLEILQSYSAENASRNTIGGVISNAVEKNNKKLIQFKNAKGYQGQAYSLLKEVMVDITRQGFGSQAVDEETGDLRYGNVKNSKNLYPIIAKNYRSILKIVPGNGIDTNSNAQFEFDKFLGLLNEKFSRLEPETAERVKKEVFNLLDGLRKVGPSEISNGIYAKPRIETKLKTNNKLFARVANTNIDYFQYNVQDFNMPLIRTNRQLLLDLVLAGPEVEIETEELTEEDVQRLDDFNDAILKLSSESTKSQIKSLKEELEDLKDEEIINNAEYLEKLKFISERTRRQATGAKPNTTSDKVKANINKVSKTVTDANSAALIEESKIIDLLKTIESSSPFLLDTNELVIFKNELERSLASIEYFERIDQSLYNRVKQSIEEVTNILENVQLKLNDGELIEDIIQKNIMQNFTELPVFISEGKLTKDSSTKELLVAYHKAKNEGNLEAQENALILLNNKYSTTLGTDRIIEQANNLLKDPLTTIEDFQRALEIVSEVEELSQEEVVKKLRNKVESMRKLEEFKARLNELDFDTETDSQGNEITQEDYLDLLKLIPAGEARTIFKSSLERNISDSLAEEGEKIINFTLRGYKSFLSSSTENKAELEAKKVEWNSRKGEILANLSSYTFFIADKSKIEKLEKEISNMINNVDDRISKEEQRYEAQEAAIKADNKFPGVLENLPMEEKAVIENLSEADTSLYMSYLNGEIDPMTNPRYTELVLSLYVNLNKESVKLIDQYVVGCKK